MGLMMVVSGVMASLVALGVFSANAVRNAEDLLPDHEQMAPEEEESLTDVSETTQTDADVIPAQAGNHLPK
jgi:hypothetical protein